MNKIYKGLVIDWDYLVMTKNFNYKYIKLMLQDTFCSHNDNRILLTHIQSPKKMFIAFQLPPPQTFFLKCGQDTIVFLRAHIKLNQLILKKFHQPKWHNKNLKSSQQLLQNFGKHFAFRIVKDQNSREELQNNKISDRTSIS